MIDSFFEYIDGNYVVSFKQSNTIKLDYDIRIHFVFDLGDFYFLLQYITAKRTSKIICKIFVFSFLIFDDFYMTHFLKYKLQKYCQF